jgi:DUF1016 N-terminal domain
MLFIEQKPLLNHKLVRYAIVDLGKNTLFLPPLLAAIMRGTPNALMTAVYWEIGRRIVEFEQCGRDRAAYGDTLISRLGEDLSCRFGRGFSQPNLWRMRSFYLAWPGKASAIDPAGHPLSMGI